MNPGKRNPDPYRNVDWAAVRRVQGCTHMHCQNGEIFQSLIAQGLEFATFSNYYPSAPTWPIREICENDSRLRQASYFRNRKFVDEELDFRKFFAENGLDPSLLPADGFRAPCGIIGVGTVRRGRRDRRRQAPPDAAPRAEVCC